MTIRGTVYATIFGRERKATVPLYREPQAMPDFGNCGTADQGSNLYVWCQSVFPWRQWTRATLRDTAATRQSKPGTLSVAGYGPFHTDPGISPLTYGAFGFSRAEATREWVAELRTMEPLDHVIRGVRFDNVRLEDFEVIEAR